MNLGHKEVIEELDGDFTLKPIFEGKAYCYVHLNTFLKGEAFGSIDIWPLFLFKCA